MLTNFYAIMQLINKPYGVRNGFSWPSLLLTVRYGHDQGEVFARVLEEIGVQLPRPVPVVLRILVAVGVAIVIRRIIRHGGLRNVGDGINVRFCCYSHL